ncbi:MAG TPA: hypothetical protein VMI75_24795 [Polyangiaceae bacterium]|nr:hypothetical protein [Polyangiaceae bacterium]
MQGLIATPAAPSVEAYLASLPRGLASYPECVFKGDSLDAWLRQTPTHDVAHLVSPQLAALLDRDRPIGTWVPEVQVNALYLAIRDAHFADDAAYLAHAGESNRAVLDTPFNRVVFWAASPRAILRSAGLRWGSLHRGSSIEVRSARDSSVEIVLSFPRGLFPEIVLRANALGMAVALENTGARDVEVHLRAVEPTRALFAARWRSGT